MLLVPVAVAVFCRQDAAGVYSTWIQQRTYGALKGFWEFPGGKIEEGESPWDALVREIREETNVTVSGEGRRLGIFPADYGDKRILLHVFIVPWEADLSKAPGKIVEVTPSTTGREWGVELLPANFTLVDHLRRALYDKGQ